ncbi:uncharacterized protein LOC129576866 [Sitodiplosis mosellana]|uniref:uncharacterized protein LOC129576866 n=1 Tax=Sitodiplosis mosellana TaxID=263140 RepID=UPI002444C394|nr:uncharacterized protein LOC129576866 [Sitodiplosis mosellana]XP_055318779.1 uncharacterized protein LOC129576866 [Sitodiplosis mosellana]
MWKQVYRNKFLVKANNVRYFLSEAYKCSEAWESRLQSPVLQKIRPDLFYYELDRKFQQHGKICAVDLDIFVNTINDNALLNELSDLVHKMRLTAETSNTLASTSHAVIRHHLDFSNTDLENLIYILDDRLSYGVFLDSYAANLCLDKLIKLKNYRMAAKVATFLMLQENFENPINRVLSLYASYKYLDDPQSFDDLVKNQQSESDLASEIAEKMRAADPKAGKKQKKRDKKEEIRVRINYLRNPYFDDHFDLRNSHHLVGKTFLAISQYLDGAIGNSVKLLGYTFYEKYTEGIQFIESLNNTNQLYKDVVDIVKKQLEQIKDRDKDENYQHFRTAVDKLAESSASLESASLEDAIRSLATATVNEHETKEIEEQTKIYALWGQIRETKLQDELNRVDRHNRLEKVDLLLQEMAEEEEKLWFFENETKIDLEIEKISTDHVKTQKVSRRQQKIIDDAYIPPEVSRKRN